VSLTEIDVIERNPEESTMTLSMGPQHPSTHGVLQVMVKLSGETIETADMEIGYLHTGIEKSAENLFWTQAATVIERMDYLSPLSNALCYVLAVEQLLGVTDRIPPRAQAVRVLLCELTRIASHCVWLGTHGIDLGAIGAFFYAFDVRENILDLVEASGGARMHPNYIRIGGLNGDIPRGFLDRLDELIEKFPGRMVELRTLLQNNPILRDRMIDVGILSPQDAIAYSVTGPSLRASGIAYDVRKAFPYSGYESYEFDVPTRTEDRAAGQRDDCAFDGSTHPPLQNRQRRFPRPAG
jgi:NADH-quinone oxidoreductase subunit D